MFFDVNADDRDEPSFCLYLCAQKRVCQKSKLRGYVEENSMPNWPQQVCMEPGPVLPVSDRQAVVRRVLGLSASRNAVRRVRGKKLDSSVQNRRADFKAACAYQITASVVVQSEVRVRCFQQGWHARLKRGRRTACVLSGTALQDIHRSKFGIGAGVGVGRAFLCRRRYSKMAGSRISLLLLVQIKTGEKASWPSVKLHAPFLLNLFYRNVQLQREYGIINFLQKVIRERA